MEETLAKLKIKFPSLPKDVLRKIYKCRLERIRVLMHSGLPEDIRWIIEAKVRLTSELQSSFIRRLPGMGRSSFAKKRRAKRLAVCHKCARWTCNTSCRNPGMLSLNREDKIRFIKNGLSKESLDNILQTLETHSCGRVHGVLLSLVDLFHKEKERYNLGDSSLRDPVCRFIRKEANSQLSLICKTKM